MHGFTPSVGGPRERAYENRSRYQARRQQELGSMGSLLHGSGANLLGPVQSMIGGEVTPALRDPSWDAYFQALDDAGVEGMADASVGMRGRERRGRTTMPRSIYALLNELQGRSF